MAKTYIVTVNGVNYEVVVEEVGEYSVADLIIFRGSGNGVAEEEAACHQIAVNYQRAKNGHNENGAYDCNKFVTLFFGGEGRLAFSLTHE